MSLLLIRVIARFFRPYMCVCQLDERLLLRRKRRKNSRETNGRLFRPENEWCCRMHEGGAASAMRQWENCHKYLGNTDVVAENSHFRFYERRFWRGRRSAFLEDRIKFKEFSIPQHTKSSGQNWGGKTADCSQSVELKVAKNWLWWWPLSWSGASDNGSSSTSSFLPMPAGQKGSVWFLVEGNWQCVSVPVRMGERENGWEMGCPQTEGFGHPFSAEQGVNDLVS